MMGTPPQPTTHLNISGRQNRAVSVGCCLGVSNNDLQKLQQQNNQAGSSRSNLLPEPNSFSRDSSPAGKYSVRRRSTRRKISQVQRAVNFNEWSNKKWVFTEFGKYQIENRRLSSHKIGVRECQKPPIHLVDIACWGIDGEALSYNASSLLFIISWTTRMNN